MNKDNPVQHQIAAHLSWAKTENWTARTAKGRQAFEDKFLAEADGDPKRAESLRKAYFLELARKSAQARSRKAAVKTKIAELDASGGDLDATA